MNLIWYLIVSWFVFILSISPEKLGISAWALYHWLISDLNIWYIIINCMNVIQTFKWSNPKLILLEVIFINLKPLSENDFNSANIFLIHRWWRHFSLQTISATQVAGVQLFNQSLILKLVEWPVLLKFNLFKLTILKS